MIRFLLHKKSASGALRPKVGLFAWHAITPEIPDEAAAAPSFAVLARRTETNQPQ